MEVASCQINDLLLPCILVIPNLWAPLHRKYQKHYRLISVMEPSSDWTVRHLSQKTALTAECIRMRGQSVYNYRAGKKKKTRALIHMVITQLKQCFSDLVIFCDKAYNSINPIFNPLFQLPAGRICCTFASVCYNYNPKKCLIFNYHLFTSGQYFSAGKMCYSSKSHSPAYDRVVR